jgi:hypothetical protein
MACVLTVFPFFYWRVLMAYAGFSVLCEALANGDEAMAKGKSLDYVDCT